MADLCSYCTVCLFVVALFKEIKLRAFFNTWLWWLWNVLSVYKLGQKFTSSFGLEDFARCGCCQLRVACMAASGVLSSCALRQFCIFCRFQTLSHLFCLCQAGKAFCAGFSFLVFMSVGMPVCYDCWQQGLCPYVCYVKLVCCYVFALLSKSFFSYLYSCN